MSPGVIIHDRWLKPLLVLTFLFFFYLIYTQLWQVLHSNDLDQNTVTPHAEKLTNLNKTLQSKEVP